MHVFASRGGESREPLVALQALGELLRSGREPDTAPGQPSLASTPAPGEQPGALGEAESPLATPQLLQLLVKGRSSPRSPQGLLPSLLATVSLPAQLNMKHKPGWVIARGSRARQSHAKEETRSPLAPLSRPRATLLTSAESGPALPVVFDLSIFLEQQGGQLLHLVLQRQAHPNQGPHEVTGHLGWRRDTLGKVQGGAQLSIERSKQGSQQGPSKSCTSGHTELPKIPHASPKASGKWSKDISWEKGGQMLQDTSHHPSPILSQLGSAAGESLGGRARWGQVAGVGNAPLTIWGAAGGREPPMCHPAPPHGSAHPMPCSYAGNRHS